MQASEFKNRSIFCYEMDQDPALETSTKHHPDKKRNFATILQVLKVHFYLQGTLGCPYITLTYITRLIFNKAYYTARYRM